MRKFIIFLSCFISILFLNGCSLGNTPTKKVEDFLNNYNSHSKNVLTQLKEMVDSDGLMNDDQKDRYSNILKKQYKDMTYDIKDETIDGDNATVTAEIEVYDFYTINRNSQDYFNNNQDQFKDDNVTDNNGAISSSKFVDYRIEQLENAKDRVKYTVTFSLRKVDDKWILNDIDDATRQKIHGLFEH